MGLTSSSPVKKAPPTESDPLADLPITTLEEKETVATMQVMLEHSRLAQEDAEAQTAGTYPTPADNSAFGPYEFTPTPLPRDADGFVQAFEPHESADIKAFFDKYGVVVVRVLTEDECRKTKDGMWDFIERHTSVVRNRPETYDKWPSLSSVGILGNTIILSPSACENRQNVNVHSVFSTLFGTEKLRVAVMRASVMRPTRGVRFPKLGRGAAAAVESGGGGSDVTGSAAAGAGGATALPADDDHLHDDDDTEYEVKDMPAWKSAAKWTHWDMDPFTGATTSYAWRRTSLEANTGYDQLKVQGVLAAVDCDDRTGGFVCVPGVHKHIRAWAHANLDKFKTGTAGTTDPVPKDDPMLLHTERVHVRAGHLIVWDSKLAHSNFPNDGDETQMRFVQYIKMAPVSDTSVEPVFTRPELLPDGFSLTPLGRRLHGFDSWE